jgi:hypothetical protein
LTPAAFAAAKRGFDTWWSSVVAIAVSPDVARSGGDLAERFRLRGFDGIHLATFAAVAFERGLDGVSFLSHDEALNRAAAGWVRAARRRRVSRHPARA